MGGGSRQNAQRRLIQLGPLGNDRIDRRSTKWIPAVGPIFEIEAVRRAGLPLTEHRNPRLLRGSSKVRHLFVSSRPARLPPYLPSCKSRSGTVRDQSPAATCQHDRRPFYTGLLQPSRPSPAPTRHAEAQPQWPPRLTLAPGPVVHTRYPEASRHGRSRLECQVE